MSVEYDENDDGLCPDEIILKYYQVNQFKNITIPWLPETKQQASTKTINNLKEQVGLFSKIHGNQPYQECLWDLLQCTMLPFFERKYHIVNIKELKGMSDYNFVSIASCILMWNQTLGIPLLRLIFNEFILYFQSPRNQTSRFKSDVKSTADDVLRFLKMTMTGMAIRTPTKQDFCTKASEFILEPCVLVQLPWKPVVLHQWLTAALAEVLMFERDSVEFRHWPLPNKMLPLIKSLLTLVRRLKERILLGFVIINEQVNDEINPIKYPDTILDDVVLPSLPVLQFLITGKAHKMMKLLKISAFSSSGEIDDGTKINIMPLDAYCLDEYISDFNVNFCYNHHMWNRDQLATPFPTIPNFKEFLQRLITNNSQPLDYDNDEVCFLNEMEKNKTSILQQLNNQERISLTLKTIKEQIIDSNKLPSEILTQIETILKSPKVKKHPGEIFNATKIEFTHKIIRLALMYNEACKQLIGCDKESSVVAQIIILQLKLLQRNVIVKLTGVISLYFKVLPVSNKLECTNPIDIKSMLNQVQEIDDKVSNQDRSSLWSQFPAAWRKPVDPDEKPLSSLDIYNIDTIVSKFENRIGRLVYNVAKESFDVYSKGGDQFLEWSIVQYILPCFVAAYIEEIRRCLVNMPMLEFIHEFIKSHEKKFHQWITECKPPENRPSMLTVDVKDIQELTQQKIEWLCLNLKVRENARLVLGVEIMEEEYQSTITGIDQVLNYIHDWPSNVTYLADRLVSLDFILIINEWWLFIFKYTEHLFQVAVDLYKVPKHGIHLEACPKLGDLYSTSIILSELEIVFDLGRQNSTKNDGIKTEVEDAIEGMKQHRYEILKTVIDLIKPDDSYPKMTQQELNEFIDSKKRLELQLYIQLKKFRRQSGKLKFVLKDYLPYSKIYPGVRTAVTHYINGDFASLEEMLPLFASSKPKTVEKVVRKCRNCGKAEGAKRFLACRECLQQKYPDVHLFCGRRCRDARWKEEHMAEHLEFELGLGQFSNMGSK